MALNLECSSTRLLNDNILRLVILLLYVVAVVALKAPGSYPGATCSTKPDHALQTPQTEWTHLIFVRGTVLIFGHRHRLVAGRENIPYATLATPNIFVQQLETHTQYNGKSALKPNGYLAGLSSVSVQKGITNCHQATSALSRLLPRPHTWHVIRSPRRRGR